MSEKPSRYSEPTLPQTPTTYPNVLGVCQLRNQPTIELDNPGIKIDHTRSRQIDPKTELSSTQQRILETITMSVINSGWSPPITDICQTASIKSKATVAQQLGQLESRGLLRRDPADKRLWLPTSLNLESEPKIGSYRKYPRLNKPTEINNTTNEKKFNRLISKMSPEKVTIFNLILHEYPVTQIIKKIKLAKTIHKAPIEQILLGLILKPSNRLIENISQTISDIRELNFTDQIKTTIISTIPQQYPQFSNIYQIYLDNLSIE